MYFTYISRYSMFYEIIEIYFKIKNIIFILKIKKYCYFESAFN